MNLHVLDWTWRRYELMCFDIYVERLVCISVSLCYFIYFLFLFC